MTVLMRKNWVLLGGGGLVLVVVAFAWADGGREPLREMATPVSLPGASR